MTVWHKEHFFSPIAANRLVSGTDDGGSDDDDDDGNEHDETRIVLKITL